MWDAIKNIFSFIAGLFIVFVMLVVQALPIVIAVLILFWLFR